jgi:hypothetical protein
MIAAAILATVEKGRLAKAAVAFSDRSYTVQLISQSEAEIKGLVKGAGNEYSVVLTTSRAFCSCKDSMFKSACCKHAALVALAALRMTAEQKKTFHTGDVVHHHGVAGKVIAISGDLLSIVWENGRIGPIERGLLTA